MHAKTVFVVLACTLLLAACKLPVPDTEPQKIDILINVANTPNELLFNDILAQDFISTNVTVLGVRVGMTESELLATIGKADKTVESDFGGIKNFLYTESLGLTSAGVIYHLEQGTVTRITITKSMAALLQGASKPGRDKAQVYSVHGSPDRQYDFSFPANARPENTSGLSGRFFVYNEEGFESYLTVNGEYQYAFVYPMRKLPTTAFADRPLTKEELLNPPTPLLMIDTTTLCAQGQTYAYTPTTGECKTFANACVIPDNWIEIPNCKNVPPKTNQTGNNTSR